MFKVLLVDDEIEILRDKSKIISEFGYECVIARDGREGIKMLTETKPDIILTDQNMPYKTGIDLLKSALEFDPNIPVIVFTGYGTVDFAVNAMKLGAYDYLQKPFSPEKMELVLRKAAEYRKIQMVNNETDKDEPVKYFLPDIIGKSKAIQDVAKRVVKVAPSDASVLIFGESGTGKELIAKSIHNNSKRADKPFIPLDCVSLPPTLMESEIFGYEQGAFTGATKSKPGVIELANGGTLFLDEITELDISLQAKLLRFIQERQFRRVGGRQFLKVDIRIVSATNRDPEEAVRQNLFRQDLYYRLNVVPIYSPPLRERKDDIKLLVEFFIKKFQKMTVNEVTGISPSALKSLKNYTWPGNVRELQNVIEQVISLTENSVIDTDDLPMHIRDNSSSFEPEEYTKLNFKEAREQYIKDFGKKYFQDLLKKVNGNISQAARMAGVSRRTMYRLLEDFEIEHFLNS